MVPKAASSSSCFFDSHLHLAAVVCLWLRMGSEEEEEEQEVFFSGNGGDVVSSTREKNRTTSQEECTVKLSKK